MSLEASMSLEAQTATPGQSHGRALLMMPSRAAAGISE